MCHGKFNIEKLNIANCYAYWCTLRCMFAFVVDNAGLLYDWSYGNVLIKWLW